MSLDELNAHLVGLFSRVNGLDERLFTLEEESDPGQLLQDLYLLREDLERDLREVRMDLDVLIERVVDLEERLEER